MLALGLQPRVCPGIVQRCHCESLDIQAIGVARGRNVGDVVGTTGSKQQERTVHQIGIHQRTIACQTNHMVGLGVQRGIVEAAQHVVQAASKASQAMRLHGLGQCIVAGICAGGHEHLVNQAGLLDATCHEDDHRQPHQGLQHLAGKPTARHARLDDGYASRVGSG